MLVFISLMLFQTKDITLSASQMDLAGVRNLIEQGADVNAINAVGETPLMLAAKTGYNDMVKFLLENGARTENVSRLGETALLYGVKMGRLEVLRSLIHAKSPLNSRNGKGETALSIAMARKDFAACRLLVEGGAKLNNYNAMGENALHRAVLHGNMDLARILMEKDMDPNEKGGARYSPLKLARFLLNNAMAAVLEGKPGVAAHALEMAIAGGVEGQAVSLLKQNPSWRNAHGDTALMLAARYGRPEIITALIHGGADVNEEGSDGKTALHEAIWHGRISCSVLLLGQKANPNAITRSGRATPLSVAYSRRDIAMLNLLVGYNGLLITANEKGPVKLPYRRVNVNIIQDAINANQPFYNSSDYVVDGAPELPSNVVASTHPKLVPLEITKRVEASYKGKEMKGPMSGEVILSALFHRDGSMRDIMVMQPTQGFEYFAARAFRQWKFKPAQLDGKPVSVRMSFKVNVFRDY